MTQSELEELLVTTLAAADPKATAKTIAEFKIGWAKYAAAYPEAGDKPFLDAAVASGFRRDGPASANSLHHVSAALQIARERCAGVGGGRQRHRGKARLD